jgi:hypothetical protein
VVGLPREVISKEILPSALWHRGPANGQRAAGAMDNDILLDSRTPESWGEVT